MWLSVTHSGNYYLWHKPCLSRLNRKEKWVQNLAHIEGRTHINNQMT
jgi:hypothetical protein